MTYNSQQKKARTLIYLITDFKLLFIGGNAFRELYLVQKVKKKFSHKVKKKPE